MPYEAFFRYDSSKTVYAKPFIQGSGLQTPWADDVLYAIENVSAPGSYRWASLNSDNDYEIFEAETTPAVTDEAIGFIDAPSLADQNNPTQTFTVLDDVTGDPVKGVVLGVSGTGESTSTDINGKGYLHLPPGVYVITVNPPFGYEIPENTDLTVVEGVDQEIEIRLTTISISPPGAADLCTCVVMVVDGNGSPLEDVEIKAVVGDTERATFEEQMLVMSTEATAVTGPDGTAEIVLIRNVQYDMEAIYNKYNKVHFQFTVPDSDTAIIDVEYS